MREDETRTAAVLMSGGIESAVLCATMLAEHRRVQPIYIRCGLRWEEVELASVRSFLAAIAADGLAPLVVLDEPIREVYGAHWSTDGPEVPGAETPDEAVYLPGRNLLLTVKSAVWCRLREVPTLALGSLGSNPFPDSTDDFFRDLESVVGRALSRGPRLVRPFARLHKADVIRRGEGLPLHLTFSCIRPVAGMHCGRCNKCAERRKGFRDAHALDRTRYAEPE
ncbi:7-cyano-7-deazaguanine synthase [Paludisphaera soli]|uniref:7-cyano-7-deazaguanine synthase n=1 Tax=Paludisphaera soli TaxID=2712865 RepID=UPI0013EA82CD|nr:7-cyano-7-deazaguanine synthase [Paludisphaera soli]